MTIDDPQKVTAELSAWAQDRKFPEPPFLIAPWATITDPDKYVAAHLAMITGPAPDKLKRPYLERMIQFKTFIESIK